jgi:hypothetical protein
VAAHLRAAVPRELDEVERVQDGRRPREVGEEDEARLQRADEDRLAPLVVARDLRAELGDASRKLVGREIDLPDARVYDARSRRKC